MIVNKTPLVNNLFTFKVIHSRLIMVTVLLALKF